MPTIKDIARAAGVSHGTVSNVINKRGNVSLDKIKLVEAAIKELGYRTNAQAQRLRKEQTRLISVLLPDLQTEQYRELYDSLSLQLSDSDYEVSLHLTSGIPSIEEVCLDAALTFSPCCMVTVSSSLSPHAYLDCGVPVVFTCCVLSPRELSATSMSVDFDYPQAAADIAAILDQLKLRQPAFFGDLQHSPMEQALFHHLEALLAQRKLPLERFDCNLRLNTGMAFHIVSSPLPYDVVIAADSERARLLRSAYALSGLAPCKLITMGALQSLPDGDLRYELDFRGMGKAIAEAIVRHASGQPQELLIMPNTGFRFRFPNIIPNRNNSTISLLTLTSPTADALSKLFPYFKKLTGIEAKITILPYQELYSTLASSGAVCHDLVRMDMVWRARLARELCMPLPLSSAALSGLTEGFMPEIVQKYCHSEKPYTLPLDPSVQLLFYRKELFESVSVKRSFYEQFHKELTVPRDYTQLNEIASFFTRQVNPSSPTSYGTALTYGTAAVAACDFLPRLRSFGGDIFDRDGRLTLTDPVWRQAMENYLETKAYAPPAINNWWMDSMALFAGQSTAMSMVFLNHASTVVNGKMSSVIGKVGFAPVPGNHPLLGGGCIGIARNSRKTEQCITLLKWIYSEEISSLLTLMGSLSPCRAPYSNEQILLLYPWLRGMNDHFASGTRQNSSPQYPDYEDYRFEILLGTAIRNIMTGIIPVEEALASVQAACKAQFR